MRVTFREAIGNAGLHPPARRGYEGLGEGGGQGAPWWPSFREDNWLWAGVDTRVYAATLRAPGSG